MDGYTLHAMALSPSSRSFGFWFFDFAIFFIFKQSGGVVFYLGALQLGDLLPG